MRFCLLTLRIPLAFIFVILSNAAWAQTPVWKQNLPPGLASMPLAFFTVRGVAVFFGGSFQEGEFSNQTWEWDGSRWDKRAEQGPSPAARASGRMSFDSSRGVMVLFGGYITSSLFGDTWEWDGVSWVQKASTGPSPRYGHAMAFDTARGVTVLFGGSDVTHSQLSDIWEWNGTAWTLRNVVTPPIFARHHHAMIYDPIRRRCVVFGGIGAAPALSDTQEWDGNAWHLITASGPSGRYNHSMAYDTARRVTVLSGGTGVNGIVGDTWEWNGSTWRLRSGTLARTLYAMTYDTVRQVSLVFGGVINDSGTRSREFWEWNGTAWLRPYTPIPNRYGHATAFDSDRNVTSVFGGHSSRSGKLADTWEWNGFGWTQRLVTGPNARAFHAMTRDPTHHETLLFGGENQVGARLSDTWIWNGLEWVQRIVSGPSARSRHAMVFDSARNRVVLFGGQSGTNLTPLGDTWEWDGTAWAQREIIGPPPRFGHSMSYDSIRQVALLYGGNNGGNSLGDTWEFDGVTWAYRSTGYAYWDSHICYEPATNLTIQVGSFGSSNSETRIWNGSQWTSLSIASPQYAAFGALSLDATRNTLVFLAGGDAYSQEFGDTWELQLSCVPPVLTSHPVRQNACLNSVASFSLGVLASETVTFQWQVLPPCCSGWQNLQDGQGAFGNVVGANSSSLSISRLLSPYTLNVRCLASTQCGTAISAFVPLTMCRADFNCDGQVEFLDYLDFVQAFSDGQIEADVNRDQVVDLFDYLDFVQFLRQPC